MRFLADFIMRGRAQAALVVAASAAVPLLFWLSASAACLVLLRRGLSDGLNVMFWGLAPALVWCYFGNDPRPLLVLLGAIALAIPLREGASWRVVMLASIGLGIVFSWMLHLLWGDALVVIAAELITALHQLLPQTEMGAWDSLSLLEQARIVSTITGVLAALLQILSVISLMLGRYWQALLFNPGGFSQEFQSLRFTPVFAISLVAVAWIGPGLMPELGILTPTCSVPLIFASLALMHGLVAQGRMSKFWLVGLYVAMLLFLQFIYPLLVVLAIVDSLFDFRGRASPNAKG